MKKLRGSVREFEHETGLTINIYVETTRYFYSYSVLGVSIWQINTKISKMQWVNLFIMDLYYKDLPVFIGVTANQYDYRLKHIGDK